MNGKELIDKDKVAFTTYIKKKDILFVRSTYKPILDIAKDVNINLYYI